MKKLLLTLLLGTAAAGCVADYPDNRPHAYNDTYRNDNDAYVVRDTTVYYNNDNGYYGDYDRDNWRDDQYHRHWQDKHGVWHYSYYDTRDSRWHKVRGDVDDNRDMYGRRNDTSTAQHEDRQDEMHGRSEYNRPTNFGGAYDQ